MVEVISDGERRQTGLDVVAIVLRLGSDQRMGRNGKDRTTPAELILL
jgi:hypothetical protein